MITTARLNVRCALALWAWTLVIPLAFAAGDDSTTPPPRTPTPSCPQGQIYDRKLGQCVPVNASVLSDDERYQAVRELAYLERYAAAALVLDALTDPEDDRVLTYRGFLHRKLGQMDEAMRYYKAAIEKNPNNLLVRSYMGQGLVTSGDLSAARRQHQEILARGGQGTWAEVSLRDALASGRSYRY